MKKLILILCLFLTINSETTRSSVKTIAQTEEIKTMPESKKIEEMIAPYKEYMDKIAKIESKNNPKAINKFGYIGKYQFGKSAMKQINIEINVKDFKTNPEIWPEHKQDEAMYLLILEKKRLLKHEIKRYVGKEVNGIRITEKGILAAAHLSGTSSVKEWLKNGTEFKDGFGTSLTKYMKLFS